MSETLLGRSVGNFRVEQRLGAGAMGEVYLLRHIRLPNTLAALKVLRRRTDVPAVRERFVQEALVAAAVGTDRVARPIDIGRFDDGAPYIILEYARGRTLAQELEANGPLDALVALRIAHHVADTMALVHARGIVHRDLKPSNLMLDGDREDPTVKVLDFGVARPPADLRIAETLEHAIVGSPGYMSPEAATGGAIEAPSDVFSLGTTLFKCLTGTLPFAVDSTEPTLDALPSDIEPLIAEMLAKRPADRPSMAAVRDRIAAIANITTTAPPIATAIPIAPNDDVVASTITVGAGPMVDLAGIRAQLEQICDAKLPTARSLRPRNRGYVYLVLGSGALAVVAFVIASPRSSGDVPRRDCEREAASIASTWNPASRAAAAQLVGDDRYGPTDLAAFDTFAKHWATLKLAACQRSAVAEEQCLDRALARFATTITTKREVTVLGSLLPIIPSLERCTNPVLDRETTVRSLERKTRGHIAFPGRLVTVVDLATNQPVEIAFSKDPVYSQSIAWTNRDDVLYLTVVDSRTTRSHLATLTLDGKLTDVPQTDDARWVVPSPDGAFISTESVRSELVLIENL